MSEAAGSTGRAVLVVRHGQSTWNATGRWQGVADPPLSEAGVAQARRCVRLLRPFGFVAVVSSDLTRARATAELLTAGLGLPAPTVDPRLRERDVGAWTGLTDTEIARRWPGEPGRWRADEDATPPGGEAVANCTARLAQGLRSAAGAGRCGPVLVVGHGGVLRALERAIGVDDRPLGHLAGRWFTISSGEMTCGPRFVPALPDRTVSARGDRSVRRV